MKTQRQHRKETSLYYRHVSSCLSSLTLYKLFKPVWDFLFFVCLSCFLILFYEDISFRRLRIKAIIEVITVL